MFVSKDLSKNEKLIKDSSSVIDELRKLRFLKIDFNISSILFDHIKPKHFKVKDSISLEVIEFFEKYVSQVAFSQKIKNIIDSTDFTNEDISIQIDRSADTIIQIFSDLQEKRNKLIKYEDELSENAMLAITNFTKYISEQCSEKTSLDEVMNVIFICMNASLEDSSNMPFIPIGIQLITLFHKSKLLNKTHCEMINDLNKKLKKTILGSSKKMITPSCYNKLQRFNLTPDEGPNKSLGSVIEELFGSTIKSSGSLKELIEPINKILKMHSSNTGIDTGLIFVVSSNLDTYFDMSSLNNITSSNDSQGVNDVMVKTFDLLKVNYSKPADTSELINVCIYPEKTKQAYVVWTNDLYNFKLRSAPINNQLIRNICRNSPSELIGLYNDAFESYIVDNNSNDFISFNRVKYMAFDDTVSEEMFLNKFQDKLINVIIKSVGDLNGLKLSTSVVEESFTQDLLKAIEATKLFLGIHPSVLPSHCHIMYASIANRIVSKIKKEILNHTSLTKTLITEIVMSAVLTNDNIYSRVIASYYLHIA